MGTDVTTRVSQQRRGVEDPVHAWKLHAREPGDPGNSLAGWRRGTVGKGKRRTPDMYVAGESDDFIVPAKRANKADGWQGRDIVTLADERARQP